MPLSGSWGFFMFVLFSRREGKLPSSSKVSADEHKKFSLLLTCSCPIREQCDFPIV